MRYIPTAAALLGIGSDCFARLTRVFEAEDFYFQVMPLLPGASPIERCRHRS